MYIFVDFLDGLKKPVAGKRFQDINNMWVFIKFAIFNNDNHRCLLSGNKLRSTDFDFASW